MEQQRGRSILVRNLAIAALVVAATAALALPWIRAWWLSGGGTAPTEPAAEAAPAFEPAAATEGGAAGSSAAEAREALERRWERAVGSPPVWPGDLAAAPACDEAGHALSEVCAALDAAADPGLVARTGGACTLLEEAARDLAASPPDIESELKSHEVMLANVFHVFRVLGRKRLTALQETLGDRPELAEPLGLALYRWLVSREECEGRASPVTAEALYDYAGFAFTTLGGQAYLRRRTPRVESLACFYALQVVDRAGRSRRNPRGLDPRPEIRRCVDLLRAQDFVFGDRYVEILEAMERRWPAQS
jgi:hypothetical protein